MPVVTINGEIVNLLILILTKRRMERSREAGRWVEESARQTLYRYDPKETRRALEEPFEARLTVAEMDNIRDAVADEVMEVVESIVDRLARRARGERAHLFESDTPGYDRDIEALADLLGIVWPEGPRPAQLPPERQRELDETRRFIDAGDLDGLLSALRRRGKA